MSECPLAPENIQILELVSSTEFRILDVSMSIMNLRLLHGSVIVVQRKGSTPDNFDIQTTGLAYPPHGQTCPRHPTVDNPVLKALHSQAMRSELTDVVLSSSRTSFPPFQVTAHKSILALIPYFKSVFTSGMSESKASGVVNLEIPIDVEDVVLMEFLYFVYLRNDGRIAMLAPALLFPLLRLADYYGFEELSQAIMDALGKCYSSLTGELALQVLKTIHPLGLDKAQVEDMALTYIACNFSEVGKLTVFREQLEDEIYEKVVDYVARATW
jgi:BTB/POZ domain